MGQTNTTDRDQLKKAKLRENFSNKDLMNAYAEILETSAGRLVLWDLWDRCGLYRTSFTGNSHTFFNEGKRDIGLQTFGIVAELKPQAIPEMMLEAKKREDSNA